MMIRHCSRMGFRHLKSGGQWYKVSMIVKQSRILKKPFLPKKKVVWGYMTLKNHWGSPINYFQTFSNSVWGHRKNFKISELQFYFFGKDSIVSRASLVFSASSLQYSGGYSSPYMSSSALAWAVSASSTRDHHSLVNTVACTASSGCILLGLSLGSWRTF